MWSAKTDWRKRKKFQKNFKEISKKVIYDHNIDTNGKKSIDNEHLLSSKIGNGFE